MRKVLSLVFFLSMGLVFSLVAKETLAEEAEFVEVFNVYADKASRDNHFCPSGWMGDYGDLKLDEGYAINPHSGTTCIKIIYSGKKAQSAGWAGIYWQNPPNNWGNKFGGYDLAGMTQLIFWARGEKGQERIEEFKIGGITGKYPDSDEAGIGPILLTKEWRQYSINLTDADLTYISGGFCWSAKADVNPGGITFYLDDIRYESTPVTPEAKGSKGMPFGVYTDRVSRDNHFCPSGWMGDYGDLKLDEGCVINPHSGTTCIKIAYSGECSQGARWAGIYWQNPPNNWGEKKGAGFDLSKATKLTFWARGEKGQERIEEFKIGGIMGEYSDSDEASIGPIILTKKWKKYTIDLTGADLSYIIGGFCWSTNIDVNPEGCTFYLDDIRYE